MAGRVPLRAAAAGITIAILAVLVLAADQFAKHLVLTNLSYEQLVHVFGNFLSFYLIKNSGAAFSLLPNATWVFTIALSVVAIAIIWLAVTRVRSRLWAVVLGLLLGGVLGNLADRLFREPGFGVGHVVDFIYTPWMMPAFYNVADMFITTMMVCVALLVLFGVRLDGTRERRRSAVPAGESDAAGGVDAAQSGTDEPDASRRED
ncbi:MAG: signal peptidase II [Microbacterium sp.]|nr:signal peptidase II [Microbacterium sp.]